MRVDEGLLCKCVWIWIFVPYCSLVAVFAEGDFMWLTCPCTFCIRSELLMSSQQILCLLVLHCMSRTDADSHKDEDMNSFQLEGKRKNQAVIETVNICCVEYFTFRVGSVCRSILLRPIEIWWFFFNYTSYMFSDKYRLLDKTDQFADVMKYSMPL